LKQGAGFVESAEDVVAGTFPELLESRRKTRQTRRSADAHPEPTRRLLSCFGETVVPVDELIEKSGLAAAQVLEILLGLEMAGEVARHPGPAYSRRTA
jgi:predicted Rossmann fold nucleotide-binding protein DprA/Smf involved in DNA uptake